MSSELTLFPRVLEFFTVTSTVRSQGASEGTWNPGATVKSK